MKTSHRRLGIIFLVFLAGWLLLINLAFSQEAETQELELTYLPQINIPAVDGCVCALNVIEEYRDWKVAVGLSAIMPGLGNWYAEDEMTFPTGFFLFMEAILIADIFFDNDFLPKKVIPILTVSNHLGATVYAGVKAKQKAEWLRLVLE